MGIKRHRLEEIVTKLRQVEVLLASDPLHNHSASASPHDISPSEYPKRPRFDQGVQGVGDDFCVPVLRLTGGKCCLLRYPFSKGLVSNLITQRFS